MEMRMTKVSGRGYAKKLLGSLAVVVFAFSAVLATTSFVDQAHAKGAIGTVRK